jgi:putative ATP-dependent endonuclease of the OLD family
MNRPLQSAGIALIACNGNEGALKVTRFLIEHNRTVVFILDNDSATNPATKKLFSMDRLRSYLITDQQVHYIGGPNELEELYSDNQWAETANELWPRDDGCPWTPQDISGLRNGGKFSDDLKDLIRRNSEKAPSSKQEINLGLVLRLRTSDEIPEQLRKTFEQISEISREIAQPKELVPRRKRITAAFSSVALCRSL